MPTVVVRYATTGSAELRGGLAEDLVNVLPEMIVRALLPTQQITSEQMSIDIQSFSRFAYNVASLCVEIQLSPGEHGQVYEARDLIRVSLYRSIVGWLQGPELAPRVAAAHVRDVDISLVFASQCGANFDPRTNNIASKWGGSSD